jgi:UDP-N-acetyl-D-galactosamine dehydrogenase
MGKFIADQTIRNMIANGVNIKGSKVTVLGIAFKENVQDLSNSKVVDLIAQLKTYGVDVYIHDPVVDPQSVLSHYGLSLTSWEDLPKADAIIAAVPHQALIHKPIKELASKLVDKGCFTDINSPFDLDGLRQLGISVWRL